MFLGSHAQARCRGSSIFELGRIAHMRHNSRGRERPYARNFPEPFASFIFSEAAPGQYLVCDDGDLQGPLDNAECAALNCVAEGVGCTVVSVIRRHEAAQGIADFGVTAGRDFPGTLVRAA